MSGTERIAAYDRLRGLAVLLMVADHGLAVFAPLAGLPLRLTLTRASMPLFVLVSGAVCVGRGRSWRGLAVLGLVAIVATALHLVLGLAVPEMATMLFVLAIAGPLVHRWPWAWVVGGCTVAAQPWGGAWYDVGAVAALYGVGHLASGHLAAVKLPAFLEGPGRDALVWYVGHLALLACWAWGSS